ncbi:protein-disulfide reductase DsbD [Roseateles oligotrophus]|uniref:Thiol:disulfide interchange protein DsbD n=1 Tax=Roseateles oligotrophus TaxID=1769250 RepID=A0ABT2YDS3_9BURK|nr:protein-disulfide reductase DsbD [Roseateles oligotrophus]MCV2368204.1 protein-disulfide reductase DsbD [Roseateles oligotrophus]
MPRLLRSATFFAISLLCLLNPLPSVWADDFLEPEQAFKLALVALDGQTLQARFEIAPGYYMYREQFKVAAQGATLGEPVVPKGKVKFDETFQKEVEIHRDALTASIPVQQADGSFKLAVTGQGCADKGLCYPPITANFNVRLDAGASGPSISRIQSEVGEKSAVDSVQREPGSSPSEPTEPTVSASTEMGRLDAALKTGRFWTVVGVFFLAGLLLSLTPCVLPMLPILSSIIVGESGKKTTRSRGFMLALSYSLGMALVYTALGVAAGLAGEGLAAVLQKPWVLAAFALALVLFSLSMFGAYELSLPGGLTGGLSQASQKLPAGHLLGVFVMGGVSALIVSPCVAAPLAGALVYLSQTRDVVLGGSALFALAGGMSVPLLLLGISAGSLLPRAGAWMDGVKHFFGMLLLGVALWTVQPVLPAALAQLAWGGLLIGIAAMLGLFQAPHAIHRPRTWLRKTAALIAVSYGLLQVVGAASGGTDTLKPLSGLLRAEAGPLPEAPATGLVFKRVETVAELDAILAQAGRPVMLDFYADWCVSCKEMERFTFADPAVRVRLTGALLLKADVTANSAADRALLKRFKLFGPPGTIFFDASGKELGEARVIGFQDAQRFLSSLSVAGL